MENTKFGFKVRLTGISCGAAGDLVRESLAREGFGAITEIDFKATLKEKLDIDFRSYTIIGACNPSLSHQALIIEPELGLMLPCNIVVEQDGGDVVVSTVSPVTMFAMIESAELAPIVAEAEARLRRVMEDLS